MRLEFALLCDAATIRDGLLHILGGGVTNLVRPEPYPTALQAALALRISVDRNELNDQHSCQVLVQSGAGELVAKVQLEFALSDEPTSARPGEELYLPIAIPLQGVGVPSPGDYRIDILLDGEQTRSLLFTVENLEARPPGP